MKHLPPLPWSYSTNARVGEHEGKGFVYLLDANGRKIGTFWGNPDEKLATAQMVMDASDELVARTREMEQAAAHNAEIDAERPSSS